MCFFVFIVNLARLHDVSFYNLLKLRLRSVNTVGKVLFKQTEREAGFSRVQMFFQPIQSKWKNVGS